MAVGNSIYNSGGIISLLRDSITVGILAPLANLAPAVSNIQRRLWDLGPCLGLFYLLISVALRPARLHDL